MPNSRYRPFRPKQEQRSLVPKISGNSINGVGEKDFRRATHIYWHDPEVLPHGKMQKWFYTQNADDPDINKAREQREKTLDVDVPPVTGEPLQQSAEQWTEQLSEHAATLDFELFGITAFRQEWVFDRMQADRRWIVVLGVAHDYGEISKAPENAAGAEVIRQYGRAGRAARDIATWIRLRGWDAEVLGGPMAGRVLLIPPAIECGFGELGKHGSIINKEFGSSFRLSAVLTDVPLVPTPRVTYNVDDFCSRCQVCANACPPEAILPNKVSVRGESKWYVDFDKCLPFFNEHSGCAICIAVCPWSIPGRGPRIVEQLQRRMAKRDSSL